MLIAGVDEAGRGPLAGPVVAAAVILDPQKPIMGLNDSKKLTEKKREELFILIQQNAIAYAIAEASVEEIDQLNILHASMLAMKRAVENLSILPNLALIDGNRCPQLSIPSQAIIGGDESEICISAASILAKVTRDRLMDQLHHVYPHYGFAQHKGYPTKVHCAAIQEHGVSPIHRRSFGPVKAIIEMLGL